MVRWHHRLNGHESAQTPGDGDGQAGLACCSPWGHKESDNDSVTSNFPHAGILNLTTAAKHPSGSSGHSSQEIRTDLCGPQMLS